MTDDIKPSGSGAGKTVLIVLAVLFGLGLLCCAGAWLLGGDKGWYVGKRYYDVQAAVTEKLGAGATWLPPAEADEGDRVLLVGVPADFPEARLPEAVDTVWIAYCDAFADGGFPVHRIAVGRIIASGTLGPWAHTAKSVEEVAERTGRAAPPVLDWLAETEIETGDGTGATNVKVKIGAGSGDEPREGTR